jgi:hypothetical protein
MMDEPAAGRIDQLLQFVLATAGQEDDFADRQLGPIHLIKYAYLADLAYAEDHSGETFTHIPWRFHHFGPWSAEVYERIYPALQEVGAACKSVPSKYEGDFTRWSLVDDELYRRLGGELPSSVVRSVKQYVHKFSGSTEDLLHFVYTTWPMLRSKPEEIIDFTLSVSLAERLNKAIDRASKEAAEEKLSFKQKQRKKLAREQFRAAILQRLDEKAKKKRVRPTPPRHDDVYYEGVRVLESLAGEDIRPEKGIVRFSDDIWKSKARFDPDLS